MTSHMQLSIFVRVHIFTIVVSFVHKQEEDKKKQPFATPSTKSFALLLLAHKRGTFLTAEEQLNERVHHTALTFFKACTFVLFFQNFFFVWMTNLQPSFNWTASPPIISHKMHTNETLTLPNKVQHFLVCSLFYIRHDSFRAFHHKHPGLKSMTWYVNSCKRFVIM